jgi:hypothetical protein
MALACAALEICAMRFKDAGDEVQAKEFREALKDLCASMDHPELNANLERAKITWGEVRVQ